MRDLKLTKQINQNSIKVDLSSIDQIDGVDNLVQKIIKCLLTDKNSNYFNQEYGSQFFKLHNVIDLNTIENLKQTVPIIISDVENQIKQEQLDQLSRGEDIPDSEILDSIELEDVEYDTVFGGWLLKLKIITKTSIININIP